MGKGNRIKPPQGNSSRRIKPPSSHDSDTDYSKKPPIYSLERLQQGKYCLSSLQKDDKAAFADSIWKRRTITWNDLNRCNRHKLGYEKITTNSIKAPLPPFITEDEQNLIVFRYHNMKPMVGYRDKDIFYILWFDHDFTLYNHS